MEAYEKSPALAQLHCVLKVLVVTLVLATGACGQGRVEYVGGTATKLASGVGGSIETSDNSYFAFYSKRERVRVPYAKINLIEYGLAVNRRVILAVVISPAFIFIKKRKHFLTVGYADEDGKQQALVFRVDKNDIRVMMASLEARTGVKVTFQDAEARKASGA